ncbi:MAG TPA: FAD-binding oxidoreductase [Solirubrobacteraceae bacterium]|nr:FAD-binding oxidoreductase [Solirubrobacteraceae bacterium]
MRDWEALQRSIAGEVLTPEAAEYEAARKPAIARFHDVRPEAVVRCRAADDVLEAIAFADGLPVAPRSGGHCFAGGSTTTGMVIDLGPLDDVTVADGFATIGAGARLGKVYDALLEHGVTIPAGCGPQVGISGLTLGGGIGIMGRRHGLTCDSLVGATVARDGRLVECDEQNESELFWALRGAGGGRFGIVTSFTFRTLPPPDVTAFDLRWPYSAAAELVDTWQAWAPDAPDELAASLLITAGPDPIEPPVVKVFGAMLGSQAETEAALGHLDPATAEFFHGSHREVKRHLAGAGGPDEGHPYNRSEFFRERLPREAITALIEHFWTGRRPGEARELDFSPWGGAYSRVPTDATAFAHRDARFLLKHAAVLEQGVEPDGWLDRSWEIVHPWGTGGVYPNFPEPGLPDSAYWGANTERLSADARRWPPAGATPRPAT